MLYEYEEICETLKDLYNATNDEYDWISEIRNCDFEEKNLDTVFNYDEWEFYEFGKKPPIRFFTILYMLSVVANSEEAKSKECEGK